MDGFLQLTLVAAFLAGIAGGAHCATMCGPLIGIACGPCARGTGREWLARTVDLLRPRTRLLPDFSTWARAFFSDDFEYEAAAREKFWKDERLPDLLSGLADALEKLPEWTHDGCEQALRGLAESAGVKAGLLINGARVAMVGQAVAPPLFDSMLALGRERVVSRLRRARPAMSARSGAS